MRIDLERIAFWIPHCIMGVTLTGLMLYSLQSTVVHMAQHDLFSLVLIIAVLSTCMTYVAVGISAAFLFILISVRDLIREKEVYLYRWWRYE